MRTVEGTVEYKGVEYDYRAEIYDPYTESRPDRIADLDRSDGLKTGKIDLEAIEELVWKDIWGETDSGG